MKDILNIRIKRIFLTFLFCIILMNLSVYAYSNEYYSIDIPSGYTEGAENFFSNEEGLNINIIIDSHSYKGEVYTEEHMEDLVEGVKELSQKDMLNILQTINNTYNLNYTNEELNELAKDMEIENTTVKEISTFSKNNYPCFHWILKISVGDYYYYANQYGVFSKNNYFILTITGNDTEYFESSEIIKTINSFTINNYEEVEPKMTIWEKVISSMISTMIIVGIGALFNRNKNNALKEKQTIIKQEVKDVISIECKVCGKEIPFNNYGTCEECHQKVLRRIEEQKKIECKVCGKEIPFNEHGTCEECHEKILKRMEERKNEQNILKAKYCTNCGEKIKEEWNFCNSCGNKLK